MGGGKIMRIIIRLILLILSGIIGYILGYDVGRYESAQYVLKVLENMQKVGDEEDEVENKA